MVARRTFLASLAAAFVADPERLLWVPGAKVISIPKPRLVTEPYFVTEIWQRRLQGYASSGWTRRVYLGQNGPQGKLLEESLWPLERAPFYFSPNAERVRLARLVTPENPEGRLTGVREQVAINRPPRS